MAELIAPAPTAPVVSSITFDQTSYATGEKMTVTVNYAAGTSANTQTLTGTATDSKTTQTGKLTVNFTVINTDSTSIAVADSGSRVWTKVSDSGTVAVFTAVA